MTGVDSLMREAESAMNASLQTGRAARRAAVDLLTEYRLADVTPFAGQPRDLANLMQDQAYALSILISFTLRQQENGESMELRSWHLATAVDALGSLITLGAFASDADEA